MNRVFVIGDTHFGHKRVTEFRPWLTVEDHDRNLIELWNSVVRTKDVVWHLGDVCLGGRQNLDVLNRLNGTKKLVLGNHDVYPLECYIPYFSKIFGAAQWNDCALTHIPIHPQQLEHRFRLNVHGHLHAATINDSRYRNVAAEQIGYTPRLMLEITK